MTWIVTGLAVINVLVLPVLVFILFPKWLRAQGVIKLQVLRDDLWDGISDGTIQTTPAASTLIEMIERTVRQLNMFSLVRIVTLWLALRLSMPKLLSLVQDVARTKVDQFNAAETRTAVLEAKERYLEIVFRYTTVGWILVVKKDAQLTLLTIMEAASTPEARNAANVLRAALAR